MYDVNNISNEGKEKMKNYDIKSVHIIIINYEKYRRYRLSMICGEDLYDKQKIEYRSYKK